MRRRVALGVILLALCASVPALAFASSAPHVTSEETPDTCAMCHRAHTAPGVVAHSQSGSWETIGSALILSQPSDAGDAVLCLTCHGIEGFGSDLLVQNDFLGTSTHTLLPCESRYEDVPDKQCSSCHDAHGSEKRDDGTPYPALLRARVETGTAFYSGEEYCATCHRDARDEFDNRFDGLEIYRQTAHFLGLPLPGSGTEITCSNCHTAHGSNIAPLILGEIVPPAAPATSTVTANDRTFCYICHEAAQATWLGLETYEDTETVTAHGSSSFEVSVTAEYASEETTRLAGECQSCHNPMGSDNGDGEVIARLVDLEGRELCYSCHNEENEAEYGVTDMESYGFFEDADHVEGASELVVAWDPDNLPAAYGGLHVYTRAAGEAAPYELEGPRRYRPTNGVNGPRTGAMAYGDIDGSGETVLVVADPGEPIVRIYSHDPLAGLAVESSFSIPTAATAVAVGDFLPDASERAEVALLTVAGDGASTLHLYRYGSTWTAVGTISVGTDATGLASGYLTGAATPELVVTALGDDPENSGELYIVSGASGSLQIVASGGTLRGPRGPSIIEDSAVVVANSEETTNTISVFGTTGSLVASYEATVTPGGAAAWDTAVGDFLPGGATGVAVALRSETSANGVALFAVSGSGLSEHSTVMTGNAVSSSALAVGDVNGDGVEQVVVANAGLLSRTVGESTFPSVQTLKIDGLGLAIDETLWGGGTELAGGAPSVVVADLGPVGRSRHPASAVKGAHVSTETADFDRHAECVDCHNTHALTAEARDSQQAPAVYGVITGAWGLDLEAAETTLAAPADNEYEVCFKCHGPADWGESPRDISVELDTDNAGYHPVLDVSGTSVNEGTLVDGWSPGSQLYCVDCHGNAGTVGPVGPHVSPQAPLLSRPLIGALPDSTDMLCYTCHKRTEYLGTEPAALGGGSLFYDATTEVRGHEKHVDDYGLGCETCHVSHGGENIRLIRTDVDWVELPNGGACYTPCHLDSTVNVYSRVGVEGRILPTGVEAPINNGVTGDIGTLNDPDAYYEVRELQGAAPAFQVDIEFTAVTGIPGSFDLFGRYDVAGVAIGHVVEVRARDYSAQTETWDTLGLLPGVSDDVDRDYAYPLGDSKYVSVDGKVSVRIIHTSGGRDVHYLYLKQVWLQK